MKNLLERFCRYVQVETTANEDATGYPSSDGQLELGRRLASELRELKLSDVRQDENGLVWGTIPATVSGAATIAWLAHMDTSPEYTAKGVQPQVVKNYDGGDLVLPGDASKVIRVSEYPELKELKGKTLITTDGRTLLGADDKAGVAVIMTAAERLMAAPQLKHGPIRVVFTCDEEIGRGCMKLSPAALSVACAYTLDGEGAGTIEAETFSADQAIVTVQGRNTHPGYATGKMVNAIRVASEFVTRLPWRTLAPETTCGRDGFLHPYTFEGGVDQVRIKLILRSFVTAELEVFAKLLRSVADTVCAEHPEAAIRIETQAQYRNMADFIKSEPRAVALAEQAHRLLGAPVEFGAIRGGTDGSRLSEMGVPTPNLATGMHNFHSPLEYACLEEMEQAVGVLTQLAQLWGAERA